MNAPSERAERGQVLVIVAVAMTALLAMAGLVIDTGLAWSNRRESQNLTDAAAIAAARILAVDREEAVYNPTKWALDPTFTDPGSAIQAAIQNALAYNDSGLQDFEAISWGTPGAPEYTNIDGERFTPALYVLPGPVPGNAQGVYVPAISSSNTLVMKIVGISEVSVATDAVAVAGPAPPVGRLLPLIFRERWISPPQDPIVGDPTGWTSQSPFTLNCQYVFRDTRPPEIECPHRTPQSTDPRVPADVYPGHFGWISWDGVNLSNAKLSEWSSQPLNAPNDWYDSVCDPIETDETCWVPENAIAADAPHEQFWRFRGTTGNRNSTMMTIRDLYMTAGEIVYIPIWRVDPDEDYTGATAIFEVTGFATFRIDETHLTGSQKGFVGTYLGSVTGGTVKAQECTLIPANCPGSPAAPMPFVVELTD